MRASFRVEKKSRYNAIGPQFILRDVVHVLFWVLGEPK